MKKKILSTMLVCVLSMSVLAGCGSKSNEAASAAGSAAGEIAAEVTEVVESVTDDEATSIDWGSDEASAVEYTLEDIQAAFPTNGFSVSANTEGFEMTVGSTGTDSIISLAYAIGDATYSFDMYTIGTDAYSVLSDGTTTTYSHAVTAEGEEGAEATTGFESMSPNFDNVTNVTYVETKEYNGTIYDVVSVETTEGEGEFATVSVSDYYINPETKMCDYMISVDEASGAEVVATITELTEVVLPAEFETAEVAEITGEDMAGQMLVIMFLPLSDEIATEGVESGEDFSENATVESETTDVTSGSAEKESIESKENAKNGAAEQN